MSRHALLFLCAMPLAALPVVGCGGQDDLAATPSQDAEVDAPVDAEVDAADAQPDTADSADTAPEAASDAAGDVEAEAAPSTICGNGVVESGEDCDDGNAIASDGCSPTCKVESKTPADVCPGSELPLALSGASYKGEIAGSTLDAYGHLAGSCGGSLGPDQVYVIKPAVSGTLFLDLGADFAATLYVRTDCSKTATEQACLVTTAGTPGKTSLAVTKDTPVYVVVDSLIAGGKYTLSAELIEARCGDGVIQTGEQCDDGATATGDGCDASCRFEPGGVLDDCPGTPILFKGSGDAPRKIALGGDLTGTETKTSTVGHGCGNYGSAQHVYAIRPDLTGSLKVDVVAGFASASFSVASECNNKAYTLTCDQTVVKGSPMDGTLPVTKDQWVYLIVDSASTARGPYTVNLTLTKAACGNHVLDGGEGCDDGNSTDGDGCSAACTLEVPTSSALAALDVCPGKDLVFPTTGTRTVSLTGSTALPGVNDNYTSCGDNRGADVVYHFKADVTGSVVARLDARFAGALALRTVCSNTTTATDQPACARNAPDASGLSEAGFGEKKFIAPITAGKDYWLVVDGRPVYDGAAAAKGVYELQVTQQVAVCGNGIVDAGETCDDGDTNDGDGCSSTCTLEPVIADTCATAFPLAFTEVGGLWKSSKIVGIYSLKNDGTFADACGISAFGRDAYFKVTAPASGILKARVYDNTFDAQLGARGGVCATTGAVIACTNANGPKLPEEISFAVESGKDYFLIVDMPSTETAPGRFTIDATIGPTICGDGLTGGAEECDDGNTRVGDGCDASCKLEAPKAGIDDCPGAPLVLTGADVRFGSLTLDTSKLAHQHAGKCNGSGPEGVVQITPDISGTLVAKVTTATGWSPSVYGRTTCADPSTDVQTLTCSSSSYDPSKLTTTVVAGKPIWLFVDGIGDKGVATLTVQLSP